MGNTAKMWLTGCGCGCALLVLLFVGLGIAGANWVGGTIEGFDDAVETRQALEDDYGKTREFVPWADGTIPAERLERFLTVREKAAPAREKIADFFSSLPASDEEAEALDAKPTGEKLTEVFKIVRSSFGLGGGIGDLFSLRNQGLVEAEMGLGEYSYIYVIAYYAWLGHALNDSGDGPQVTNSTAPRLRIEMEQILRNQLESLDEATLASAWGERLKAEVTTLEEHPDRLPWQDGLPDAIVQSLAPYKERLEEQYAAESNPFELARNEKRGQWSYRAD